MISVAQLNALPRQEFVATLATIFEQSPWVAERVAEARPFASRAQLHRAMCDTVAQADSAQQLQLIRAHPALRGRVSENDELTDLSLREQRGAGLDHCTADEVARLAELNARYRTKFDFPFVLAVLGHDPASILAQIERRLQHDAEQERAIALDQIGTIALYRLTNAVSAPAGAEVMAMLEQLSRLSESAPELTCSYLSPAHRATAAQIRTWMLAAGLQTHIDAVGNVVGRWRSAQPGAKTLITGSHYDTVVNAGRYDGRLGVVLPIVVVQQLRERAQTLPFTLEIIAFADEEGVRYGTTFLGSSAVAGCFDSAALTLADAACVTMRAAMLDAGLAPDDLGALARARETLLGFVEVHIEQGPVLLNAGRPLGVVTAIAGSVRYALSITGLAGHAGTVPMALRRDAAAAAAEVVLAVERLCSARAGVVGTVGRLEVPGGAINVIPGRCELSMDLRAGEDTLRDAALADVLQAIEQIAARRGVEIQVRKLMQAASVACAPGLRRRWAQAIGRATGEAVPTLLASGAGHDAMKMATLCEVGMLFVRCGNGGISHHPDETVEAGDVELAAQALSEFLTHFEKQP